MNIHLNTIQTEVVCTRYFVNPKEDVDLVFEDNKVTMSWNLTRDSVVKVTGSHPKDKPFPPEISNFVPLELKDRIFIWNNSLGVNYIFSEAESEIVGAWKTLALAKLNTEYLEWLHGLSHLKI